MTEVIKLNGICTLPYSCSMSRTASTYIYIPHRLCVVYVNSIIITSIIYSNILFFFVRCCR